MIKDNGYTRTAPNQNKKNMDDLEHFPCHIGWNGPGPLLWGEGGSTAWVVLLVFSGS